MKKNTFKTLLVGSIACLSFSCSSNSEESLVEEIHVNSEWHDLFDGETFNNWKEYNQDEIGDAWSIVDGLLVASESGVGGNNIGFGHSLITEKKYSNYEFDLEYKITLTGNSGIIYQIIEDPEKEEDYMSGIEFQLLEDESALYESLPSHQTAGNYDMYAPIESKQLNGPDEWNSVKLLHNNGHVEHWLNGELVLEFEIGDADWKERKAKSKWADAEDWGMAKSGHIGLQNHGDAIWFRNIRIREL